MAERLTKVGTCREAGVLWTVWEGEDGRLCTYDDPTEPAGSLADTWEDAIVRIVTTEASEMYAPDGAS